MFRAVVTILQLTQLSTRAHFWEKKHEFWKMSKSCPCDRRNPGDRVRNRRNVCPRRQAYILCTYTHSSNGKFWSEKALITKPWNKTSISISGLIMSLFFHGFQIQRIGYKKCSLNLKLPRERQCKRALKRAPIRYRGLKLKILMVLWPFQIQRIGYEKKHSAYIWNCHENGNLKSFETSPPMTIS